MNDPVYRLARKLRPDLDGLNGQQRISSAADVLTLLYTLPLLVIGLVWLVRVTSQTSLQQSWLVYLLMAVLAYIFNQLRFFFITEIRTGGYANSDGALDGIAIWAALLLLGPTALWIKVLLNVVYFLRSIRKEMTAQAFWSRVRMLCSEMAADLIGTLAAIKVYLWVGGSIPIQDYSLQSLFPAMLAIFVQYVISILVYSGYISYIILSLKYKLHAPVRPAMSFFIMAFTLPALANPFGVLAAGIFTREGMGEFFFVILGLLLTAVLARRLSLAAEYSRQQSNQLEELEKLGRAILDQPPDEPDLAHLLQKHATNMFSLRSLLIWTESRGTLLREPANITFDRELAWEWLKGRNEVCISRPGDRVPWNPEITYMEPVILCPIKDESTGQQIGLIFLELETMVVHWDTRSIHRQLPAIQSLGAHIASALHRALLYQETLAVQRTVQELELARSIQASFLPEIIPNLPGWQVTAALEPARQIAGDYYDFIPLPGGQWGILIADVADKGLGAALYMALSSTLIRTFAAEHYQDPAVVLKTANQHILRNARANLFVTVFFGVLDPASGVLRYVNAGHNPPYLFGRDNSIKTLGNTGMPLGIETANEWRQEELVLSPGERLVLYTDGVTDAQNSQGEFIDRQVILSIAQQYVGRSAQEMLQGILNSVHRFVGGAPRYDDVTLVILGRDET